MQNNSTARRVISCTIISMGLAAAASGSTLIDFEAYNGALAPADLSAYGVSSVTGTGGNIPVGVRDMSGDLNELAISSPVKAFHPPAFFWPNTGISTTTLTFASPLTSMSFTKVAEHNTSNGVTYGLPGWKAEAFDASNALVDTVGVGFVSGLDFPNTSIQTYMLDGASPIDHVVISVNYNGNSSAGTVFLDDFTLNFVPEPATLGLLATLSVLALRRR